MNHTIIENPTDCRDENDGPIDKLRETPVRQRLKDLERGFTLSFRGDSIFFVHLFSGAIICCTAMVLGASLFHWIMLFITAIVVLATEIFYQALKHVAVYMEKNDPEAACRVNRISTAGEMVSIIGATITMLIILADCAWKLW